MVGCSNDDCLVAWFHYECVGIPQDTPDEVISITCVCVFLMGRPDTFDTCVGPGRLAMPSM